ncbi:hypothetical protein MBLNU230_g0797t1 [Neophaeotheca triangularis]
MAKREREEVVADVESRDAERAAKKAKKEKKRLAAQTDSAEAVSNGEPKSKTLKQKQKEDDPELGGLSKEERRAAKRAKKEKVKAEAAQEAAENVADGTGNDAAADEAEKKALKLADKAARKAAKAEKKSGEAVVEEAAKTNGHGVSSGTTAAVAVSGYAENPTLSALPQSEVDAFIAEKFITVENPTANTFRPITAFKHLPAIDESLREPFKAFTTPTPIQAAAWPYLFAGQDVIGVAETGSGKTLAFGLPCVRQISSLDKKDAKGIKACIVSPTRELACQIHAELEKLTKPAGLKVTVVYGGVNKDAQRETLKGTHIVVATPGRLNDFIQEGSIDLSKVQYLVLDEADRMLDKGFEEEIRKIISGTPSTGRQTLMFTATWPPSVRELASTFMNKPVKVTIGDNPTGELRANARIKQEVEVIDPQAKQNRLIDLLRQYQSGKNKSDRILVFCLYKKEATRIEEFIRRRGFNVGGIHGDLSQQKRTESLDAFKKGQVPCLVATDVAARGLDIPAVKVVINVTFPLTVEDYVHRIGRTGRAGQDGLAITMFTDNEKGLAGALINVLKGAGQPVPEDLMKFGTTVKKKGHDAYGAFYKDVDTSKKATKITFD